MKHFLSAFAVTLCCLGAGSSQAPPIDFGALRSLGGGTSAIAGITHFYPALAVCAPDIPYVEWYINKLGDESAPKYDRGLVPFTREVPVPVSGAFTCTGLSPGRYVIWIENLPPNFAVRGGPVTVAGPDTNVPNHVTMEDGPAQPQVGFSGELPPMTEKFRLRLLAIQHVILASGTAAVRF